MSNLSFEWIKSADGICLIIIIIIIIVIIIIIIIIIYYYYYYAVVWFESSLIARLVMVWVS